MPADYTPGCGARTLEPEAGMLDKSGMRVVAVACNVDVPGDAPRVPEAPPGAPVVAMGSAWSGTVKWYAVTRWSPDLTDNPTYDAARSALARRLGLDPTHGVILQPYGGAEWRLTVARPSGQHAGGPAMEASERRIVAEPPVRHLAERMPRLWVVVPGLREAGDVRAVVDRGLWATREAA